MLGPMNPVRGLTRGDRDEVRGFSRASAPQHSWFQSRLFVVSVALQYSKLAKHHDFSGHKRFLKYKRFKDLTVKGTTE
jgi:hypothetical protein